jgi:hypothetical protein
MLLNMSNETVYAHERCVCNGARPVCQQWVHPVISYGKTELRMKLAIVHFLHANDAGHRDNANTRLHVQ